MEPAPNNGWSIVQCLIHLNSYAEFYHPRIARALVNAQAINDATTFRHSLLGRYFINSMDADKTRKKFKAMRRHLPYDVENPNTVVSAFIQHLENMLGLLKQAADKNLEKKSVKTSFSSWFKINPGDAIQFLLTHNRRHLEQARRNLLASKVKIRPAGHPASGILC